MLKWRCLAHLAILSCLVTASQAHALPQAELDAWRSKWDGQQLDDYGYRFQRSCFCFGEFAREVIVRVEDGAVVSATDTQTLLPFDISIFPSVNGLFDELQSAVDYPAAFISADFDATLGYPNRVSIDLDERIADEEIYFVAADLSADLSLPSCDPEAERSCAGPLIDALSGANGWWDTLLDYTGDNLVDAADRDFLITNVLGTTYGDSNLDGHFDSSDFVAAFQAGEFEDNIAGNSTWSTGDWNGDYEFESNDLVLAFQVGGYELDGPVATRIVPEPCTLVACLFGLAWLSVFRRNAKGRR